MTKLKFWKPAFSVVAMGLLIFLAFTRINFESPLARIIQKPGIFVFSQLSYISSFVVELNKIRSLTEENLSLREENIRLLFRIAQQLQIEEENKSLREALNLPALSDFKAIDAGTFNVNFDPKGHHLLINKGFIDGIRVDSSVISTTGVLLGRVVRVFDSYSVVGVITDPNFKATIRIVDTDVSGIARGNLREGIFIDFISQNDDVKVDQTVITDGNDMSPPGLIIGKIVYVSTEDGNVFKKVQVKPAMESINISKVMVLMK